jgi:protein-S-isoprenylcysteine O-methyltransferase Ste14
MLLTAPSNILMWVAMRAVIPALWLVFIVYWAICARFAKRNLDRSVRWKHAAVRLCIIALSVIAASVPAGRHLLRAAHPTSPALVAIGTMMVALGIGLCIYARIELGRNWGMPMSRKENPELVTGGPYAVVRHPIYSGIILAMAGSAIGQTVLWALPLVLFGAYFIYSARREEELMRQQFPDTYPAYMARTNMLIPYLL